MRRIEATLPIAALAFFVILGLVVTSQFSESADGTRQKTELTAKAPPGSVPSINDHSTAHTAEAGTNAELSADAIARRFIQSPSGSGRPAPGTRVPPQTPEALDVPWISYLGMVEQAGLPYYYFKDSRSNRILALAQGKKEDEWVLESRDSSGFIVKVGEERYHVSSAQQP